MKSAQGFVSENGSDPWVTKITSTRCDMDFNVPMEDFSKDEDDPDVLFINNRSPKGRCQRYSEEVADEDDETEETQSGRENDRMEESTGDTETTSSRALVGALFDHMGEIENRR